MPNRRIAVDGATWDVSAAGHVTQYDADEFGVWFVRRSGDATELRVTRVRPVGARLRDQALSEASDATLIEWFRHSQPSATSPEGGYAQ